MNRITKFFHELSNPHCEHCLNEKLEEKTCNTCEILKLEIERLRQDNEKLLNRVINPTEKIEITQTPPEITTPRAMPWRVRQQILEAEDRKKAQLLKQAPKPDINDLEKELGVVEQERENATTGKN